jgi:hypothetical protein
MHGGFDVSVTFQKCCVENQKYIIRNRTFMLGSKITVKSEILSGDIKKQLQKNIIIYLNR